MQHFKCEWVEKLASVNYPTPSITPWKFNKLARKTNPVWEILLSFYHTKASYRNITFHTKYLQLMNGLCTTALQISFTRSTCVQSCFYLLIAFSRITQQKLSGYYIQACLQQDSGWILPSRHLHFRYHYDMFCLSCKEAYG